MSGTDRRSLLRIAAAAILLPAASAWPARAHTPAARFSPPHGSWLYERRLERTLGDGARLEVTRSFAVSFAHEAEGYRVDGEQVGVEASAPEALATFARMERERRDDGVFPLLLDAEGRIRPGAKPYLAAHVDEPVREAGIRHDRQAHDPAAREELRRFMEAIRRSAGELLTELPIDLFAPDEVPRIERREVGLPDGSTGLVTMTFTAHRDPATGLMRQAMREVITDLGGSRRHTAERWRLDPIG